jgi:hypothetical protein
LWETSFMAANIASGFAKTGIWPHNPEVILSKIRCPEPPPPPAALVPQEQTPMTCRAVWRIHKAYKKDPTAKRLNFKMNANSRLAAQNSIANHTITGPIEALKMEKRNCNHGKWLNLVGEEESGPQFFSPSRVLRAKAFADEKEAGELAERQRIDNNKATALANRIRKEQDRTTRAVQASIHKKEVAEKKLQKALEIQARKEQRESAKQAREALKARKALEKATAKLKDVTVVRRRSLIVAQKEGVFAKTSTVTSRGQAIVRPTKLLT